MNQRAFSIGWKLIDEMQDPATALVELDASRWEEELFFRELKSHLHGRDNLLDAQPPETAAREVLAMLLAASLVAMQREVVRAPDGNGVQTVAVTLSPGRLINPSLFIRMRAAE